MKDLAPGIYQQRLLIEGIYEIDVQIETIHQFFATLLRESWPGAKRWYHHKTM